MTLAQFLSVAASKAFDPGHFDCLLFPADWVRLARGSDPAAPWRGTYRGLDGCEALLTAEGGTVALMDKALLAIGLARTESPVAGDVGAVWVRAREGRRLVGGIKTDIGWAVLGQRGLMVLRGDFAAAWSV